ncbi:hypothetical protein H4582DRAFT_1981998 [Lactarius indigo]|nr:hypothetical protein H4582DRAFT_1981998 [Lactarius indigo]
MVSEYAHDTTFTLHPIQVDSEITGIRRRLGDEMKPQCAALVVSMYNFKTSQGQDSISHNARRARDLLSDMNFIYPEFQPGLDPYRHPIIQRAIGATWFRNKSDIGIVDHEHFFPIPISNIALTLTVIQWCIDEWSSGTQGDSSLSMSTRFQTVYDSHVSSLLEFQAHSPARNTDALFQLQCDLSRKAREHARVSPDPFTK